MEDFLEFKIIIFGWNPTSNDYLSGSYSILYVANTGEPDKPSTGYIDWEKLHPLLAEYKGKKISKSSTRELRYLLREFLFPNELGIASISKAEAIAKKNSQTLRITLDILDNRLVALPWELTNFSVQDYLEAPHPNYSIIRHERSLESTIITEENNSLEILLVSTDNIVGYHELDTNSFLTNLANIITDNAKADQRDINIELIEKSTADDFLSALQRNRDIVYFLGHGDLDRAEPVLVFRKDKLSNLPYKLSLNSIASFCALSKTKLVDLTACHSGHALSLIDLSSSGIAGTLSKFGIPSVIGMQDAIRPNAALAFTSTLYRQLSRGLDLEHAVIIGRLAIAQLGYETEWAIPIVYIRQPHYTFFVCAQDRNYQAKLLASLHEVEAGNSSVLLDIVGDLKVDINLKIDSMKLTGNSKGIKIS